MNAQAQAKREEKALSYAKRHYYSEKCVLYDRYPSRWVRIRIVAPFRIFKKTLFTRTLLEVTVDGGKRDLETRSKEYHAIINCDYGRGSSELLKFLRNSQGLTNAGLAFKMPSRVKRDHTCINWLLEVPPHKFQG